MGNADSRRNQTLGSLKSEKDSKTDASPIELAGRKVIGQAQGQGSGLGQNPGQAPQSKQLLELSAIKERPKAEELAIYKRKEKNGQKQLNDLDRNSASSPNLANFNEQLQELEDKEDQHLEDYEDEIFAGVFEEKIETPDYVKQFKTQQITSSKQTPGNLSAASDLGDRDLVMDPLNVLADFGTRRGEDVKSKSNEPTASDARTHVKQSRPTHKSCLPVGLSPTMGDIPDQLEQRQGKKNRNHLKRLDIFDQLKGAGGRDETGRRSDEDLDEEPRKPAEKRHFKVVNTAWADPRLIDSLLGSRMSLLQRRAHQSNGSHSNVANNESSNLAYAEEKTASFISGPGTNTIAGVTDGTIFRQGMSENDVNDNFYSRNSNFKSNLNGHVSNQISATVRQEAELNEKIE